MYSHLPHSPQDWSLDGENVCRIVDCPTFRKVYSQKRALGDHLNSAHHTKIESRHRSAATGVYEPEPPFPILVVFEQEATQSCATVIEGTDKDVQTPQNVPDDEESIAFSDSMDVDSVDAHSDQSQSRASLDEQCDEVALPEWIPGGLQEMCIFELIKTSWHQPFNRLRQRAEGEDPPSEESIDDDAQLVENGSFLGVQLAQKKAAIEKEGGKQAKAIRAKEREEKMKDRRKLRSRTLGIDRLASEYHKKWALRVQRMK
ncbi:hypothetical protein LB507_005611 [Fusarium sp. FIESC RH6]|nr:hypothetical protein LB507_005611 [Fusarium sp. FIESC RH6]